VAFPTDDEGGARRLCGRFGGGERKKRKESGDIFPKLVVEGLSPKRCVGEHVGS
jgi:hypothetical protein